MYTQEDYAAIDRQFKKRSGWVLFSVAMLLTGLIVSFVIRIQWLSVLLMVTTGFLAIFLWGLVLSPLNAYRKFLRDLLGGRKREYSGQFQCFEKLTTMRDGVSFYPFLLTIRDADNEKDERLLYWDSNLPLPQWNEGAQLWVSTFDKSVFTWRLAD